MRFISRITNWITTPYTIYLVLKDPAISRSAKLRAIIVLTIIFLLIIIFADVPFVGWLIDLIILPLGLVLVRIITPGFNIVEKSDKARATVRRILLWTLISILAAILLGLLWLGLLIYFIVKLITH